MEFDPIRDLENRRRELQERWFLHKKSTHREGAKSLAWVAVGALGVAVDVAALGGVGTVMAAIAAKGAWDYRKEVKRLEKELKAIDQNIADLKEERASLANKPSLQNKPSVQAEFSPAAQRKVDGLQSRLEELEKTIDKLTGQDPSTGKPKIKPAGP